MLHYSYTPQYVKRSWPAACVMLYTFTKENQARSSLQKTLIIIYTSTGY